MTMTVTETGIFDTATPYCWNRSNTVGISSCFARIASLYRQIMTKKMTKGGTFYWLLFFMILGFIVIIKGEFLFRLWQNVNL